ncbi:alpha-glucoside permease [Brettanomyces bruxellensis AWRI1499]|nr:alpha-glucoside permease [Brettanomyces bruxellensis AWRI1499]
MTTKEENDSSSSQLDIDKGKDEQLEFSIPSNVDDEIIARFIGASDQVKEGEKDEKEMGFKKAFSTYPKSAIWSVVISSGIIMEGYDTCLSMIALPIFCERFWCFGILSHKCGKFQQNGNLQWECVPTLEKL